MNPEEFHLEEYRDLRTEIRTKAGQIVQVTMAAVGAIGALWWVSLSSGSGTGVQYCPFVASYVAIIVMYWVKQMEFSGHRIAKYIREELEPFLTRHQRGVREWEMWVNSHRGIHPRLFGEWRIDRVHVVFSPVPILSGLISCLSDTPESSPESYWHYFIKSLLTLVFFGSYIWLAIEMEKNRKNNIYYLILSPICLTHSLTYLFHFIISY